MTISCASNAGAWKSSTTPRSRSARTRSRASAASSSTAIRWPCTRTVRRKTAPTDLRGTEKLCSVFPRRAARPAQHARQLFDARIAVELHHGHAELASRAGLRDGPLIVALRRDLRQMGDAKHLALL